MRKRPNLTETRFDQWADDLKSWIAESVSPFADDTPAKQAARKQRGAEDRLYFCKRCLPHYFPVDFGEFHGQWEQLTLLRDQAAFVAAPREHAKSTFFSFGVVLRKICYQLCRFHLQISDTNDQATGFTLPIRLELEDNPRLKHDFGDLKGPIWKSNDFTTKNGVRILARGRGEKVRGLKNREHRPDSACVDDFENDENVENPKLVKKGKQWLKRAVIGSMGAGFNFIMVGNLFHPKSVLAQFIAEKDDEGHPLYISRVYDCWVDFGRADQRPLWPALWPAERLAKKQRQMGTVDFNAEMRNLTGAEDSPFQEKWFVYYDPAELEGKLLRTASFMDPSAKNGEANDFKANITVSLDPQAMVYYVRHAWIRRATISAMFDAAYRQHDEYGGPAGIEDNMLEDFLHEAIYNYAKEQKRWIPWQPKKHSTNKEARIISTLSYLVEYGKLRFIRHHSDQDRLIEQLIFILNKNINDDGPDALEGAVAMIQAGAFGEVDYTTVKKRQRFAAAGAY